MWRVTWDGTKMLDFTATTYNGKVQDMHGHPGRQEKRRSDIVAKIDVKNEPNAQC